MNLAEATIAAERYVDILRPHCDRIEIAGSIRRKKPHDIKDVEIVCIPKMEFQQTDMFAPAGRFPVAGFIDTINTWEKVKGEPTGKYTQRLAVDGGNVITLDIFMATPENWGNIFLIRTGSWQFSKWFMGTKCPQKGFKQEDGYLCSIATGEIIPMPEEIDLFKIVGMEFIKPEKRDWV